MTFAIQNSQTEDPQDALSNWRSAFAAQSPPQGSETVNNYLASRGRFESLSRGYAAAIVLSLVFLFVFLIVYLIFRPVVVEQETIFETQQLESGEPTIKARKKYSLSPWAWVILGEAIFDALVMLAAFACFTSAMGAGPLLLDRVSSDDFDHPSGGELFLVFAIVLKGLSVPILGAGIIIVAATLAIFLGILLWNAAICSCSMMEGSV